MYWNGDLFGSICQYQVVAKFPVYLYKTITFYCICRCQMDACTHARTCTYYFDSLLVLYYYCTYVDNSLFLHFTSVKLSTNYVNHSLTNAFFIYLALCQISMKLKIYSFVLVSYTVVDCHLFYHMQAVIDMAECTVTCQSINSH